MGNVWLQSAFRENFFIGDQVSLFNRTKAGILIRNAGLSEPKASPAPWGRAHSVPLFGFPREPIRPFLSGQAFGDCLRSKPSQAISLSAAKAKA